MRVIICALIPALFIAFPLCAEDVAASSRSAVVADLRPMKIGCVDIARVLKACERRSDIEVELRELNDALREKEKSALAEIERLKADILLEKEQLAPGAPVAPELEERYKKAVRDLERFRFEGYGEVNKKYADIMTMLYNEILQEVAVVAAEGDFDMIIKDQTTERKPTAREEVVLQISSRTVLYSRPEYDLTRQVVERLNKKYAAEKAAAEKKTSKDNAEELNIEDATGNAK